MFALGRTEHGAAFSAMFRCLHKLAIDILGEQDLKIATIMMDRADWIRKAKETELIARSNTKVLTCFAHIVSQFGSMRKNKSK